MSLFLIESQQFSKIDHRFSSSLRIDSVIIVLESLSGGPHVVPLESAFHLSLPLGVTADETFKTLSTPEKFDFCPLTRVSTVWSFSRLIFSPSFQIQEKSKNNKISTPKTENQSLSAKRESAEFDTSASSSISGTRNIEMEHHFMIIMIGYLMGSAIYS